MQGRSNLGNDGGIPSAVAVARRRAAAPLLPMCDSTAGRRPRRSRGALLLSPARSSQLKHPLSRAGKADDLARQPPALRGLVPCPRRPDQERRLIRRSHPLSINGVACAAIVRPQRPSASRSLRSLPLALRAAVPLGRERCHPGFRHTLDAYARAVVDYLAFCARADVDVPGASRADTASSREIRLTARALLEPTTAQRRLTIPEHD